MPLPCLAVAAALVVSLAVAPAAAAEPLTFTVRPSGIEDPGAAARIRQERLSRRLEESEWALRAICRRCSREIDRNVSSAPFAPLATLNGAPEPGAR